MNLLAIDQGSRKCGWAVLRDGKVVAVGILESRDKDRYARYKVLLTGVKSLISEYKPTWVAIEDVFQKRGIGRNIRTPMIMGETRGIIMSAVLEKEYPPHIENVNPSSLTKYLGINPRIKDKKTAAVEHAMKLGFMVQEDAADAILIGLVAWERLGSDEERSEEDVSSVSEL